jgi:hypothetical protein
MLWLKGQLVHLPGYRGETILFLSLPTICYKIWKGSEEGEYPDSHDAFSRLAIPHLRIQRIKRMCFGIIFEELSPVHWMAILTPEFGFAETDFWKQIHQSLCNTVLVIGDYGFTHLREVNKVK